MNAEDIKPVEWGDWRSISNRGYANTYHGISHHHLIELGDTTNGYRYNVTHSGHNLINVVIRPQCCRGLDRCPVGRRQVPMAPCRESMRAEAIKEAHLEWVSFIRTLSVPID